MRHLLRSLPLVTIAWLIWLFVGFEYRFYDHEHQHLLFLKQNPTLQMIFENPVACGECDLRYLEQLDESDRRKFGEFCRARYDIDWRLCFAIFAEEQRLVDRRIGYVRHAPSASIMPSGLPEEVDSVIAGRQHCDTLRNETVDPEDAEKARWRNDELADFCDRNDLTLEFIRAKYLRIAAALAAHGPRE